MFCPMCGVPNEDDSIFCANCGAVLNPEALTAEVATAGVAGDQVEEPWGGDEPEIVVPESVMPEEEVAVLPPRPSQPARPSLATAPSLPTSGLAIASLLLGLGGLTVLPLLGSIAAIILGYMARSDIRHRPGQVCGDGLALAGIVLGWISVGLAVLGVVVFGALGLCGMCGAMSAGSY